MAGTYTHCLICQTPLPNEARHQANPDGVSFTCPQCGHFFLTGTAESIVDDQLNSHGERRPVLSHYIRRRQVGEHIPKIYWEQCKHIIEEGALPTVFEQADTLLTLIGDHTSDPGKHVGLHLPSTMAIMGALSTDGVSYCLSGLQDHGLVIEQGRSMDGPGKVSLTFSGWKRYEELKRGAPSGWKAFIAMKFGDDDLNLMLDKYFRPAVEATGFKLFRLDDEPRAGLIDDRLRVEIKSSRFLISDLTHDNNGAYWEAGYAEGLDKPVIYTCEKSKFEESKTHFDTNHHLTVSWDKDNPAQAVKDLKATVRATFPEAIQEDKED